ncbi:hypothetical protein OZ379_000630 [Salmonella enterica]|uniref:DUF6429 domain-containing protein n=1 Tax=Salmonella enterica subsp. salamae serovar 30:1,z28:z6 TaxID=1967615 RepID=A0A737YHU5_SALER|nr:DUF6429 family protein [Salmonella enterica]EBR3854009.1 hypothetical protein [Salmonella enterica subsp. enterica]ECH9400662.1 hypothetical protein [Salmonella enterica subsp. diarizonae]ECT9714846.1 hypothetical protein [Salmonella enterica subsp. diarizonae str. CFSAN000553]EDD5835769.1 hypothetical protein [Salmonella enterica subsp. enterica serovar Enteritidis]EGE4751119.1 hypothetical protein [Salmonella enterica subsp. diarizonae serovar 38:[k]:z35]ESJ19716.1 hypothetical protein S
MDINTEAIDDVVLALLWLTLHDYDRAWKGGDRDVLNRLYERGFIGNPVNKAKSVVLTEEGLRQSRLLFQRYFSTEGRENDDETDF